MYRIPSLGTFAGAPALKLDAHDARSMRAIVERWTRKGHADLDFSTVLSRINPWDGTPPRAIDSFAGMGGFSVGATMAGVQVVWAVNHWQEAVNVYRDNHPWVKVAKENIAVPSWDWRQAPAHQILIASPSCKGHTRSLGKYGETNKKLYDELRSTARAVLEAAEVHLPEIIVVENVPEFRSWGARTPDGRLYQAWVRTLEAMDYTVTENVLNAADAGARCSRERLFIVARQGREGITIPKGDSKWKPVEPVIDWTDELRGEGQWNPLHPKDRRRAGMEPLVSWVTDLIKRGEKAGMDRGIIPYFGTTKDKKTPLSVRDPLDSPGTRSTFAVYDLRGSGRYRMIRPEELKEAFGFPAAFRLPRKRNGRIHITQANTMLANGVSPIQSAHIFKHIRSVMESA